MLLLAKVLSVFSPLAIGGVLSLLFLQNSNLALLAGISLAITGLSLWVMLKLNLKEKAISLGGGFYIFQGIFFIFSYLVLFLFLESIWFKSGLLALALLALYFYYGRLFKLFYTAKLSEPKFNFDPFLLGKLTVLFIGISAFGFKDFLSYNTWPILGGVMLAVFFLDWLKRRLSDKFTAWRSSFVATLVLGEIFWALSALPVVYYLKGLIFALFYLALSVSLDSYFNRHFSKTVAKNYLLTIAFIIILILATARWF
ncbi:MAG: hypothetical protein WCV73_00470 [Patescibacteria group bacterium]|jgi:hypothetical protein